MVAMDGRRATTEVNMHPTTRRNLVRAFEREAVAAARMTAYARRAERDGDPGAARTLRGVGATDLGHAIGVAEALGWVGTIRENVLASVIGDATSQGLSYATLAGEATEAGAGPGGGAFPRPPPDETETGIALRALTPRPRPAGASRPMTQPR